MRLTNNFLARHGVHAEMEFSWGATEVKVPDLVDAIVDVTETGSSLRANNLRIVDVIMESSPRIIANKAAMADSWKRENWSEWSCSCGALTRPATKWASK